MSSTYASSTPSQVPRSPLHKALDAPSIEPLTDNTEPLQDTPTVPNASQDVPLSPPLAIPLPHEAKIVPHGDLPSEQIQSGHADDVDPQLEVTAEPALVASDNLNALSPVPAAEPSSNADSPPASGGDDGLSQQNGTISGEMGAQVTNENSVPLAKQVKQNGHAECDDQPQLEATVAEVADQSPADTTLTPFLDETTAHANETTIIPPLPSTEGMNGAGAGGTKACEEASEYATVAHRDVMVLEAVPESVHDSAGDGYSGENPAKIEVPADITPTPMPIETARYSETDAPLSSQQDPAEGLDVTLSAVPMDDRAKEGSTEAPSQPTTDQDQAPPVSADATEFATSQSVDLVVQAAEPPPSSDPAVGTADKGSELVVPPNSQTEVVEQPELNPIATNESKEEDLPSAVDVENSTSAPQCQELPVKVPGQGAPRSQEEGTTSAGPVHEASTLAATDAQDPASLEPTDDVPAQSVELVSAALDPQVNTTDPVVPPLTLVDRPEATNDQLDLAGASASAPPPEELAVNVQADAEECELESIPKEDGDDLVQPISNADLVQREVKQEAPVELTNGGMY
jgi:hypothetical protein